VIRIRISPGALQDLNEGFLFYEAQDPGLGDYFVSSLRADIEGLIKGYGRGSSSRLSRLPSAVEPRVPLRHLLLP
jgi:hypothetical protein